MGVPMWEDTVKGAKNLGGLVAKVVHAHLDVEPACVVAIPRNRTVDEQTLKSVRVVNASAAKGVASLRVRSGLAMDVVTAIYKELPEQGPLGKEACGAAMRDKVYVTAGTEFTIGRLTTALPKKGSRPPRPVTRAEAAVALKSCGLSNSLEGVKRYELMAREGEMGVSINANASNGFPVLGKWDTPGADVLVMGLITDMLPALTSAAESDTGVWDLIREWEHEKPWLTLVQGKCKSDYYTSKKLEGLALRFYNVMPRQMALLMQRATQPFEKASTNLLVGGHSFQGGTMTHGGADVLVTVLDEQLREHGVAFAHVGDDSMLVFNLENKPGVAMFALDCSNFDLTQHASVTKEVHDMLRERLRGIDKVGADVWYAYARQRNVVTFNNAVYTWKHAGPSGLPLQSKVNDVLMDVLCHRLWAAVDENVGARDNEAEMEKLAMKVAKDMGFVLKLEDYVQIEAVTVREALKKVPFKFIGYFLHTMEDDQVYACCDLPRTLAQMPYPSLKWVQKQELLVKEAMRLNSILMNFGIPPVGLEEAFRKGRLAAETILQLAILTAGGSVSDEKLRWAVQENPHGPNAEPTLQGLLKAVQRDPMSLWGSEATWEDAILAEATPTRQTLVPRKLEGVRVGTRPPTSFNVGRPAPTKVWAAALPKLEATGAEARAGPSRRGRRGMQPQEHAEWLQEARDDLEGESGSEDSELSQLSRDFADWS